PGPVLKDVDLERRAKGRLAHRLLARNQVQRRRGSDMNAAAKEGSAPAGPSHTMARSKKNTNDEDPRQTELPPGADAGEGEGDGEEVVLEGTLVCALTGEHRPATPQEETLQSFVEQLHREYGIELDDMARDVMLKPQKVTVRPRFTQHG